MTKSWYLHVRDETMAPARMISFMQKHAEDCSICLNDPDLKGEIAKITEMILPESKIPKAVRMQKESEMEEEYEDEEENVDEDEDDDDEIDEDMDDEFSNDEII